MNKRNFINHLKQLGIYKKGDFVCKSGQSTNEYWDFRLAISNGIMLRIITYRLINLIREKLRINLYHTNKILLGGMAISGIPIVSALGFETECNSFIIRDKPKERGTKQQIEGNLIKESKVILFDDLINSGTSTKIMKDAIKEFDNKIEILGMFSIFNRSEIPNIDGIPCHSLLTLTDWRNND